MPLESMKSTPERSTTRSWGGSWSSSSTGWVTDCTVCMSKSPTRVRTAALPSRRRAIDAGAAGSGPISHPASPGAHCPAGRAGHGSSAPPGTRCCAGSCSTQLTASGSRHARTRHALRVTTESAIKRRHRGPVQDRMFGATDAEHGRHRPQDRHAQGQRPRGPPERTRHHDEARRRDRGQQHDGGVAADGGQHHHRHATTAATGPPASASVTNRPRPRLMSSGPTRTYQERSIRISRSPAPPAT